MRFASAVVGSFLRTKISAVREMIIEKTSAIGCAQISPSKPQIALVTITAGMNAKPWREADRRSDKSPLPIACIDAIATNITPRSGTN